MEERKTTPEGREEAGTEEEITIKKIESQIKKLKKRKTAGKNEA